MQLLPQSKHVFGNKNYGALTTPHWLSSSLKFLWDTYNHCIYIYISGLSLRVSFSQPHSQPSIDSHLPGLLQCSLWEFRFVRSYQTISALGASQGAISEVGTAELGMLDSVVGIVVYPLGSMYLVHLPIYMWLIFIVNVGKYIRIISDMDSMSMDTGWAPAILA